MQKLKLAQQLNQKLSPQQIQFIKLLQVPTTELDSRIENELESNPALDEGKDEEDFGDNDEYTEEATEDINVDDFVKNEDWGSYRTKGDSYDPNQEKREKPLVESTSMTDLLIAQVGYLKLSEHQHQLALQLVGSLDAGGYLRRELESIEDDLLFTQNIMSVSPR